MMLQFRNTIDYICIIYIPYNVYIVYVLYTFFGFIHFYCNVMFSSRFFGAFSFMAILMKLVHLCVSPMCSILLFHLALQMFCQSLKSFDIWVFKNTFDLLNQIHSLHSLYTHISIVVLNLLIQIFVEVWVIENVCIGLSAYNLWHSNYYVHLPSSAIISHTSKS